MVVCSGLFQHLESLENYKTVGQKFIFQIGILNPYNINKYFSFN